MLETCDAETPRWQRATAIETASDALVRTGQAPAALLLYRQAWSAAPQSDDDHPDVTARFRIACLCHQSVAGMRRDGIRPRGLAEEIAALAAPITAERCGKEAPQLIRWQLAWARGLGGEVRDAIAEARGIGDDLADWRLADLLAACWRAGYRDAVDSETRALLRPSESMREALVWSRLRVDDEDGAAALAARLTGLEQRRWLADLAVRHALAGRDAAAAAAAETWGTPWREETALALLRQERWGEAERFAADLRFSASSPDILLWTFQRGGGERVAEAARTATDRPAMLQALRRPMLRGWPDPRLRDAAAGLRAIVRGWRDPAAGWPWDDEDAFATTIAVLAVDGDWHAVAQARRQVREELDGAGEEPVRLAVIALLDDGRREIAEALLARAADAPCADQARAWLAAHALRADDPLAATGLARTCASPAGRRQAALLMLQRLAWLHAGRPDGRILDWMDPRDGL